MRRLALMILAIAGASAAGPAPAQTLDPRYPVCLHVFGDITYYECRCMTMAACMATASGRAAECLPNPYLAAAEARPARRLRQVY
jgi:hypothetical protein